MENLDVVEIAMGKSILDRSSNTNVGILMLEYGGSGYEAVGTCRVPKGDVDEVLAARLEKIAGSQTTILKMMSRRRRRRLECAR